MINFYIKITFFVLLSSVMYSQKRVVLEREETFSKRSSSLLEVDVIPFGQFESFIEESLFGFCVDIYDMNIYNIVIREVMYFFILVIQI